MRKRRDIQKFSDTMPTEQGGTIAVASRVHKEPVVLRLRLIIPATNTPSPARIKVDQEPVLDAFLPEQIALKVVHFVTSTLPFVMALGSASKLCPRKEVTHVNHF